MIKSIPEGFHTLTPTLVVGDAVAAIELYKKVFDAKETYRLTMPDEKIMHACLQVGGSKLFLTDYPHEDRNDSNQSLRIYLYVDDVDAVCKSVVNNGFEQIRMPPEDMFWGDRLGALRDPFGVLWSVATHTRDPSSEEIEKGQRDFLAEMAIENQLPELPQPLEALHAAIRTEVPLLVRP